MKYVLSCILLLITTVAQAQYTIIGKVVDSRDNQPLIGAAVTVTKDGDSPRGLISDNDGNFTLKVSKGKYLFRIAYMGYASYEKTLDVTADVKIGTVKLKDESRNLEEVKVAGTRARQEVHGDTTVFNADAYKVNPDAMTEDLLKKMPGITISGSSITAGGEEVKKVLVDGKEFFGDDPMVALKNISADMVDKIEVFDKQSDQAAFTGFSDGQEQKTINITTKMGLQGGYFGRVYAGGGYIYPDKEPDVDPDRRFAYDAGGNINYFKGDHRVSLIGMINNVNQQNFSFDDVTGAMSMGGGRSMRGAFNPWQSGKNRTGSIGVNYGMEKLDKIKIEASYFYNNNNNRSSSESLQEYFQEDDQDSLRVYDSESYSKSWNNNHRANARITWTLNDANQLILTPNISWQGFKSRSTDAGYDFYILGLDSTLYMLSEQSDEGKTTGFSTEGDILWLHRLNKDKRSFSFRFGWTALPSTSDETSESLTTYAEDTDEEATVDLTSNKDRSWGLSGSGMYIEPLGQWMAMSFEYAPSYSYSYGNKSVDENGEFSETLSNKTESNYWTHRAGIGLNFFPGKIFTADLGVAYQYASLEGVQIYPYEASTHKDFSSVMPSLRIRLNGGAKLHGRLRYRTNTNAPAITKLQDVVDMSNTRNYTGGNRNLNHEYTHDFRMMFVCNNPETSRAIFLHADGTITQHYVANSTIILDRDTTIDMGIVLPAGVQYDKPVNMSGYFNIRGHITLATPIKAIGSNFNLNLGAQLDRTPSIYNGVKVYSRNYKFDGGITIGSSFSENYDFTLRYDGSYNIVKSDQTASSNYNYYNHQAGLDLNCLWWTRLVFYNSLMHQMTSGMGDDYDTNYLTWNAALACKFFKDRRGEVRFKVNDILDSSQSVSRSIHDAYIQTSRTDVLGRYFMLTFTYKFKPKGTAPQGDHPGPPPGMMGPPPGGPR